MEKEIWKDIPQYEGCYQVSNLGRVRSLDRVVSGRWGAHSLKGKLMHQVNSGRGYKATNLCLQGKEVQFGIHKLVAMAFLGHVPNGHVIEINHIDKNPLNNRLDNLEVLTQEEHKAKDVDKTSKYYGVYWKKSHNRWCAQIRVDRKQIHIGHFKNEIDAHNAYQKKLKEISK